MYGSARLAVLVIIIVLMASPSLASDARWRLLMFDSEGCTYCEQWDQQIGGIYAKTREGKLAPLERTELGDPLPTGIKLAKSVRYTPTFVLLSLDGRELGRISGYPGEIHFWGLLEELFARADRG
jgi:hypothetical protein